MTSAGLRIIKEAVNEESLEDAIGALHYVKQAKEEIEREFQEAQQRVITIMQSQDMKQKRVGVISATVVQRSRPKYNEESLAKQLGAEVWNKVTKKILDTKKLEQAINDKVVDVNVVAGCTEFVNDKPYVRLTVHEEG
jgi:hypothetical protein